MAQSTPKERTLLGIKPFWDRPTLKPPLRWERKRIIWKMATLAKEGISISYNTRGIPVKAVSLTYFNLGTEARRIFGSLEPTVQIDQISTKNLWDDQDNVFTKQMNMTFYCYTFFA